MTETFRVAAVVAAPVVFDAEASAAHACDLIKQAGEGGAAMAAFGETWLPGYPWYALFESVGPKYDQLAAAYLASGIRVPGLETEALCAAAAAAQTDVVIGVVELDPDTEGSVYCTLLFIGSDGLILGRHRKLKPTQRERAAWGEGDGSTLVTYGRPYARLSGLNCWEHNMMLPGYALACQGTQVHVATWPEGFTALDNPLARSYARQAGCYVVSVGTRYEHGRCRPGFEAMSYDLDGGAEVIDPSGNPIATTSVGSATILFADCSIEHVLSAKAMSDIGGHYSRRDVFEFAVKPPRRWGVPGLVARDPQSDTAHSPPADLA